MNFRSFRFLLIPLTVCSGLLSSTAAAEDPAPRAIEVLFLGAPTENHPGHDPIERYREIRKHLGTAGIHFSYSEDLAVLNRETLDQYDALLLYANWDQGGELAPERLEALLGYVNDGHGFLPLHCASACFGGSEEFVKLVGGRFESHGAEVFRARIVAPEHPVMRGYETFEAWDETYVHDAPNEDRVVLQMREEEPWTWVRNQGQGKVFYTAYGHDMRCWTEPGFHELLRRGILWSISKQSRAAWLKLDVPKLETEEMKLPGYRERKLITRGQVPLSPTESMKLAHVPVGFELSLFASEPEIVNPIFIGFDARGRAYVIEALDYPNNLQIGKLGNDRIKIAEDTDGDGAADKFTVFADGLSIPSTMVFANGGVICTNGSNVLFLRDNDGDDRADERTVLFRGFGIGDTHAGPSNFQYAPDGWIYGTVGYSGFDGEVGGEKLKFSSGVFRFLPDGSKLEFLQGTTNNTWGLGFTRESDLMGSTANANPSWYMTAPLAAYQAAGLEQGRTPRADSNPKFFPSSTDIRQVDVFDGYTAAAGHEFYTSARFPEEWRDLTAFICEPTGKLVGRFDVERKGADYVATQLPNNLYDSADAWSAPVQALTGPDGAVWVADWYNIIIQHNPTPNRNSSGLDATNGRGNAYETPLRDKEHGRIYRIFPKGSNDDENPRLSAENPDGWIAALSHPNLFWRMKAQQMIVESGDASLVPKLEAIVRDAAATTEPQAMHAYRALLGVGVQPNADLIAIALASPNRGLRRAGLASELVTAELIFHSADSGNGDDRDLAEQLLALGRCEPDEKAGAMLYQLILARPEILAGGPALADAWQIAARRHAPGVILAAAADPNVAAAKTPINLLPNPGFETGPQAGWSLRPYNLQEPGSVSVSVVEGGRNGGKALKISSEARADAGAGLEVRVKPLTRYRFGGWIRTENLQNRGGRGAMMNIHGGAADTRGLDGNSDWTEVSAEFTTNRNQNEILLHCLFGAYGGSVGTAYFDDVYFVEISTEDPTAMLTGVLEFYASKADLEARSALAGKLGGIGGEFARAAATRLGTGEGQPELAKERVHQIDPEVHKRGLEIYSLTCVACHGPDGKGVAGAFPPLDGAEWAIGDESVPVRVVLHGLQGPIVVNGQNFLNVMPPHIDLNDQQISDVLTYVRQSWSNDVPAVKPETVKELRGKFIDRKLPWTAAELK